MYKIIALIGPAGSGKDTIMKRVLERNPNLHEIINYTTRPPREGEVDGVDYLFVDTGYFANMILNSEMIEASNFNDWFYGTGYESLRSDCINIGVFNPEGIESMMVQRDIDLEVYYVRAGDKERLIRQLNREKDPDVHEIIRRFKADWVDFSDLDFKYKEIVNNTPEDLENAVDYLANIRSL